MPLPTPDLGPERLEAIDELDSAQPPVVHEKSRGNAEEPPVGHNQRSGLESEQQSCGEHQQSNQDSEDAGPGIPEQATIP